MKKTITIVIFLLTIADAGVLGQGLAVFTTQGRANSGPRGSASDSYTTGSHTVSSTIDVGQSGYYRFRYDTGFSNRPVILLLHGWGDSDAVILDADLSRWAARGYFAAAIKTRQTKNVNGRELYDVKDIVDHIKSNYSSAINQNKFVICGYSNGGGTSLGLAAKFPDLFDLTVDFFGMSDFGYSATYGWYYTNTSFQSDLASLLGDPASNQDKYRSRNALEAVTNYRGRLMVFHDADDSLVAVSHSQRINTAMSGARFSYTETNSGSANRANHAYPKDSASVTALESNFSTLINTQPKARVSQTGTFRVIGFLATREFSVWLGSDGTSEVVDVVYDLGAKSYTVTPLIGTVSVTITQGTATATQLVSSQTTITL